MEPARYTLESWTVEEGLPQNSVLCLLQDRTGYIWFGTQSGLVRFDGAAFRIYNRWNTGVLKSDRVSALHQDKNGTLWIGTDGGGLYSKKNDSWRVYTTKEGLSNDSVRAIYSGKEGSLWVGTANGLNRLTRPTRLIAGASRDELFKVFTTGDDPWGNSVTAIVGGNNGPWIGTDDNGLYRVKDGIYRPYRPAGPLQRGRQTPVNEITALCRDGSGRLWIGTEGGLLCLENGKIRRPLSRVPQDHPVSNNAVRSLMQDRGGSLWIGTDGEGIYRLTGNRLTTVAPVSFRSNPAADFIYAFLQDREGNVWVGTYTSGLVRLTPARADAVTTEDGLPENLVRALTEDENGCLWMGTDGKGVVKLKDNNVMDGEKPLLPGRRITALYRGKGGETWIGTRRQGIVVVSDGVPGRTAAYTTYTSGDGLSSNEITVIRGDGSGTIWIGTRGGLNKYENGRFTPYTSEKPHVTAVEVAEDHSRRVTWVATTRGLMRVKEDRLEDVLTLNGKRLQYEILSLYADSGGNLWIGTGGSGLVRFNAGAVTVYTTDTGLPNNYIFGILEDEGGNLWMSSYTGVFRVSLGRLKSSGAPGASGPPLTPLCFDEKDGMPAGECVKGGWPTALKTSAGKLYFPTVKGVAVFEPAAVKLNTIRPPVLIQQVLADNVSIIDRENPVLAPGKNMMEFYFTALSFTAPGKVVLRYKLEGFDAQWLEVAPRRERAALYLNLGPGSYRFRVTAANNDGLWNENGAAFEFKIKAPFYQSPLFYVLLALVPAVLILTGFYLRYLRGKRGVRAEHAQAKEPKYKTSALSPEIVEDVLPRLMRLMEEEKIFLKADLTLKTLAGRLNVHYNYLSQIINEHLQQSFNDFINSFRIEEAKRMLADPAEQKKTILDIAYDTGFYSKSVFNTAFKKFTNQTPSQYRKK